MAQQHNSLHELFLEELRDLYDAEKQIAKALPRMAKAAKSPDLKQCFEEHEEQTRGQIDRLEKAFEILEAKSRGKHCAAVAGLVEEAKELMQEKLKPEVLDVGLIAGAQKVEHYEIASYGAARDHAKLMGHDEVADLLEETLAEEKETDEKLNKLAVSKVNQEGLKASRAA